MSKTPKSTEEAANSVAEAMAQLQKMGLSSMTWLGADWVEKMSDLGSEMLQFMSERVKEDVAFQHQCLHCQDVKELQKIQAAFVQKAIDQYTDETGKLIEMSAALLPTDTKDD